MVVLNVNRLLRQSPTGRAKASSQGNAYYDNPRENIDPHLKTKVISSKEGTIEKVPINDSDIVNKKFVDDNYLKLDCSNDPLEAGTITIHKAGLKLSGNADASIYTTNLLLSYPTSANGTITKLGFSSGDDMGAIIKSTHYYSSPYHSGNIVIQTRSSATGSMVDGLTISPKQFIGIGLKGEITPAHPLHVSLSGDYVSITDSGDSHKDRIRLGDSSNNGGYIVAYDDSETPKFLARSYAVSGIQGYFNAGNVGFKTDSPTAAVDINSDIVRLRTSKTPASAAATGNAGDICWDADYIYICVAANTWKRSAISTW